jgi:RNA-binding protein YhbY
VRAVADELAVATGADVVQVIGRTLTLYRPNPESKRKPGDAGGNEE